MTHHHPVLLISNIAPLSAASLLLLGEIPMFAQVTAEHPLLYSYGPMGIMLAWFMWRGEKWAANLVNEQKEQNKKLDTLGHRFDGVQKAMLIEVLSRENCHPQARAFAEESITRIAAREQRE